MTPERPPITPPEERVRPLADLEAWTAAGPAEPLTPELVLVSPDLAERARAALPDRPWEQFLPPAAPAAGLPPPARPRRRRRVTLAGVSTVLLALGATVVLVGSWLPPPDKPTLRSTPGADVAGTGTATPLYLRAGDVRVDEGARVVLRLRTTVPCAGDLVVEGIPFEADGRFTAVRRLSAPAATVVWLDGRVVGTLVQGTLRATRPGCDSGDVRFMGLP